MKKRKSNVSVGWLEEEMSSESNTEYKEKQKSLNTKNISCDEKNTTKIMEHSLHDTDDENCKSNSSFELKFEESSDTENDKDKCDEKMDSAKDEDNIEDGDGSDNSSSWNNNILKSEKEINGNKIHSKKKGKKRKKGLVYVTNLPKHMNVTLIREYLGQYGDVGRVYLQPDKTSMCRSKKRKNMARHFSEGWIEFLSKRVAKEVASKLNNTQIGTRKKSKFYDSLWCIKYLPSFKWVHLSERLAYEQAVYKKRLMAEISQARKESDFFQQNLDKSEFAQKLEKRKKKDGK